MLYFFILLNFLWADESLIATGAVSKSDGLAKDFSYERYHDKKGDLIRDRSVYKKVDGAIALEEFMETVNGKFLRYDVNQKQSAEKGWILIDNKHVIYGVQDEDGQLKKVRRSLPKNFIVPLHLLPFIKDNWGKLIQGDSVSLKLGVWERKDHYSFYMKKVESPKSLIIIKMQLSNIILRAFTSPMYFTFDKITEQIKTYQGPLNLKEGEKGDFSDYIGFAKYSLKKAI